MELELEIMKMFETAKVLLVLNVALQLLNFLWSAAVGFFVYQLLKQQLLKGR